MPSTRAHALEWDPDEELQVEPHPADEVFALARSGGITHALVLNALMLFEPRWRELRAGRGGPAI